jgi:hypothetical protein
MKPTLVLIGFKIFAKYNRGELIKMKETFSLDISF